MGLHNEWKVNPDREDMLGENAWYDFSRNQQPW
jgi:hypothetical protein